MENPIIDPHHGSEHPHIWHSSKAEKPYDSYSVQSLTVLEALYFSEEWKGDRQERHALLGKFKAAREVVENTSNATPEQQMLAEYPYDLCLKDMGVSSEGMTNVVVDLSATDEQILSDFHHWLTAFRQASGISAPAHNGLKGQPRLARQTLLIPAYAALGQPVVSSDRGMSLSAM